MSTSEEKKDTNWNIDQGDYKRNRESTNRYNEQIRKKNIVRMSIMIGIYAVIIGVIAFIFYETLK